METIESALIETTADEIVGGFNELSNFMDWVNAVVTPIGASALGAIVFYLLIVFILKRFGPK